MKNKSEDDPGGGRRRKGERDLSTPAITDWTSTSAVRKLGLDDEGLLELIAVVDLFSGFNKPTEITGSCWPGVSEPTPCESMLRWIRVLPVPTG
jgi:hypothetical protein